jgi:hypothetical protein
MADSKQQNKDAQSGQPVQLDKEQGQQRRGGQQQHAARQPGRRAGAGRQARGRSEEVATAQRSAAAPVLSPGVVARPSSSSIPSEAPLAFGVRALV